MTVTSAGNDIARVELQFTARRPACSSASTTSRSTSRRARVADVSLSGPVNPTTVLQGTTTDIPISLTRINGSNGPLTLSATNLPAGVSATFTPEPRAGHAGRGGHAPDRDRHRAAVLRPAGRHGDGRVDPAERARSSRSRARSTVPVTVRTQFELSQANPGPVQIPHCAPADVGLRVQRDFAFATQGKTVSLAVGPLPAGVTAEFLPSATISPNGGLIATPTLRFTRQTGTCPPASRHGDRDGAERADAHARSSRSPTRRRPRRLDPTTTSGAVPSRLQPGSTDPPDRQRLLPRHEGPRRQRPRRGRHRRSSRRSTGLTFSLPRLATTGAVKVVPPDGATIYACANTLTVRSTRNIERLSVQQPRLGEPLVRRDHRSLVGTEEMFLSTNPCWPFYDCTIALPIPDPVAYLKWQVIEQVVQESGGHCFGISRFLRRSARGGSRTRSSPPA